MVRAFSAVSFCEEVKEPNSLVCLYGMDWGKRAEAIPLPGAPTNPLLG